MATSGSFPTGNLIESASSFFGHASVSATPKTANEQAKAKQQRAMAHRLAQLHAALGDPASPLVLPSTTSQAAQQESPASSRLTRSLSLAGMISGLVGAGMTAWLILQQVSTGYPLPDAPAAPAVITVTQPSAMPVAAATPATMPAEAEIPAEQQIDDLLTAWRNAWAARDTASYLGVYSQHFVPANGSSREEWVAARSKKLAPGPQIILGIREIQIERLDNDNFRASFLQDYVAGHYREIGTLKTLLLVREDDSWRIAREEQR